MSPKSHKFQTVGQAYHDFVVTKVTDIHELQCQLIELKHRPTGAQVMYIGNDDPENLFCLSFQTIPQTSNGVAHILEHTVLCGSKNFPVKDPFFAMQRRSLNTFMNALTGADFTCYPAATQVHKDFYNLLSVYLDAVFHPIIDERSFMQEGHRLEFEVPNDPNSQLQYKGIVFNEMKGALTSSGARLNEAISKALFPDLTYGINSGGDPKDIPKLTYEELCNFHKEFYHPSRCLFFFYGNMPLEGHLDFIEKHALQGVHKLPPLPVLPVQPRFQAPKYLIDTYPVDEAEETEEKAIIAFGWLTCNILDQLDLLALSIIEIVLMDTDASPLKLALLRSGLCKQATCYMDGEITEVPIIITVKGCNAEDADALEAIIKTSLKEIVEQGVPLTAIDNAMHQLEFFRSEITGDQAPFGLSLFLRSGLLKQHGGEAESGLKIHSIFNEIRKKNIEDPGYFGNLIKKYLIDNPHFVRLIMLPDKSQAARETADEKARLSAIQHDLNHDQKDELVRKAAELALFQQKQEDEDIDILPTLTLDDVPRSPRVITLNNEMVGHLNTYHHACFTNEIVYADLVIDLPHIAEEDLTYARLLTTIMTQVGCNGRNYAENLEYIQANTGGIGASFLFNLQVDNASKFIPSFSLRGKALHRKVPKLFSLMHEICTALNLDDKVRLKELILKQYIALQSGLSQNALKYAINLSSSALDIPARVGYYWFGLEYFWTIERLAKNFDELADELIVKLKHLNELIKSGSKPDLVITCDAAMYDEIKRHQFYGLATLETVERPKWTGKYTLPKVPSQGRMIASPIAFVGKVMKTVPYTHPDTPALTVAAFMLDNVYLHTALREKGGAYGGGAVSSPMSANFYFYSYRDPNIVSSIDAFQVAVKEMIAGNFEDVDVEEAKLEMIQGLDAPLAPGSRGDIAYGWLREGKTYEVRKNFRDKSLALTKQDIIDALKKHVLPEFSKSSTVVFASRELLEKENGKLVEHGLNALPIFPI